MTTCFRLCSSKYPGDSGIGAALHGGRWNPPGVEVVYAAASASLAALEVLVHFSSLPRGFVMTGIRIPPGLVMDAVQSLDLPADWQLPVPVAATQEIGRDWVSRGRSAVLSVPSSIIPAELLYLLNPGHPDFTGIEFLAPVPFRFDPRLK